MPYTLSALRCTTTRLMQARMSLPAENPAATWQLQTFDPSAIGVPVTTPLPTEGAAETGQLVPTPTGSAATAGPAWTFAELSHAKWEITQRRAVAMAWKLGLTCPARELGRSKPMELFEAFVAHNSYALKVVV